MTLPEVLLDIEEYLQKRSDVADGSYGMQVPNEEMHLLMRLQEAIEEMKPGPGADCAQRTRRSEESMKDAKLNEGWQIKRHRGQRVYHYIGNDGRSLCLRLGFYTGELAHDYPGTRTKEDCSACLKILLKREARKA